MEKKKIVFISWAPYCSRSDNIARELNGKSFMVYYGSLGSNYITISFKYFLQALDTIKILVRERPQIVFCMTPPIFTSLPAWLYTKIFKKGGYVLDYHTAAFVMGIYRKLYSIQGFFARRSLLNIVTNDVLKKEIDNWGAESFILGDIRVRFEKIAEFQNFKPGFNIAFVGRYSPTEPLDILFDAAKYLREYGVNFYVTGSLKDAPREAIEKCPENVYLTDFLEDPVYGGLLNDSDAVMSLCTNDNTMQRGAYEAMSLETPIIISDWDLLRRTFSKGAVYVKNDVESIIEGVKKMLKYHNLYSEEIRLLKEQRARVWENKKEELLYRIEQEIERRNKWPH